MIILFLFQFNASYEVRMGSFRAKLVFGFIIYGILLTAISLTVIYNINSVNIDKEHINNATEKYKELARSFDYYIKHIQLKLLAVKKSDIFNNYLLNESYEHNHVQELFLHISQTSENIMQLRYLDNQGRERIRIDRKEYGGQPFIVSQQDLQDKSTRYYFRDILAMDNPGFWYSKIDLNKEHGIIERPIKPVLRVGMPIMVNNKKAGVLIINIFMANILERLSSAPLYDVYMVDNDGYFIMHADSNKSWGRYLSGKYQLLKRLSPDADFIHENAEFSNKALYVDKLKFDNNEQLRMVVVPKSVHVSEQIKNQSLDLLLVFLGMLLLIVPASFVFSNTPVRLKRQLDVLNKNLEEKVKEGTKELTKSNEELKRLATTDPLTGIPNRRCFFEMAEKYYQNSKRFESALSLLMIDIDKFKHVNDTYGHQSGDAILKTVAELLVLLSRKSDVLARVGGEEFVLLLQNTDCGDAAVLAEKVRKTIDQHVFMHNERIIPITVSIGVSQLLKSSDIDELYATADKALYMAKKSGRNCVEAIM